MLAERRFDLFQFDAEATDLHLVVNTTEVVDVSIQPIAGDVAALIQSCPRLTAERVWDELLGGQIGTIEIASRQAGAADVQLARNSNRNRLAVPIQNVDLPISEGTAYGNLLESGLPSKPGRNFEGRCRYCGLRWAVSIDQTDRAHSGFLPAVKRFGRHYISADDDQSGLVRHRVRDLCPLCGEFLPVGCWNIEYG